MDSLRNKNKLFFLEYHYVLMDKFISSIYIIRNFLNNKFKKIKIGMFVNNFTLELDDFKNKNDIIYIQKAKLIYRFTIPEILNIFKFSLKNVDKYAYLDKKMGGPKNPYDNIDFSLKDNLIIYENLKKYYIKKKCIIPVYILNFKACYFSIDLFFEHY